MATSYRISVDDVDVLWGYGSLVAVKAVAACRRTAYEDEFQLLVVPQPPHVFVLADDCVRKLAYAVDEAGVGVQLGAHRFDKTVEGERRPRQFDLNEVPVLEVSDANLQDELRNDQTLKCNIVT